MIRTRSLVSGFLSLSAAAALTISAAGGAAASPAASDEKKNPEVVSAVLDSTGAADYWTTDRMRQAVSGEVLGEKALARGQRSSVDTVKKDNEKKTVQPAKGNATIAVGAAPVKHVGKVFFTLGGANYVCSANAVASKNKSTVVTAGHCLSDGLATEPTNFVFVPAYENGAAPYGKWTGREYFVPAQWDGADMTYDTGFAVMNPLNNQKLQDVVGGSGITFNEEIQAYTSFGYPASKPFTGETLHSCSGTATADPIHPEFGTRGIPCDMNGGSSGGPWFIQGTWIQNSINSYGYTGAGFLYGPYWGDAIEATFDIAQRS